MNNYVVNFYPEPLYVYNSDSYQLLSNNGQMFSTTTGSLSIAVGNYQLVQLSNPTGSAKTIYISKISVSTSGASVGLSLTLYRNGSFSENGTTLSKYNNNFASSNASVAEIKTGLNYTVDEGSIFYSSLIPISLYTNYFISSICLPPNTKLLIKLSEIVEVGNSVINLSWIEV